MPISFGSASSGRAELNCPPNLCDVRKKSPRSGHVACSTTPAQQRERTAEDGRRHAAEADVREGDKPGAVRVVRCCSVLAGRLAESGRGGACTPGALITTEVSLSKKEMKSKRQNLTARRPRIWAVGDLQQTLSNVQRQALVVRAAAHPPQPSLQFPASADRSRMAVTGHPFRARTQDMLRRDGLPDKFSPGEAFDLVDENRDGFLTRCT